VDSSFFTAVAIKCHTELLNKAVIDNWFRPLPPMRNLLPLYTSKSQIAYSVLWQIR